MMNIKTEYEKINGCDLITITFQNTGHWVSFLYIKESKFISQHCCDIRLSDDEKQKAKKIIVKEMFEKKWEWTNFNIFWRQ